MGTDDIANFINKQENLRVHTDGKAEKLGKERDRGNIKGLMKAKFEDSLIYQMKRRNSRAKARARPEKLYSL